MTAGVHEVARAIANILGAPVFPIFVSRNDDGKWQKYPLTRHGHLDADRDPDAFSPREWGRASGVGVCCGAGLYVLDVDDARIDGAPIRWLKSRGIHSSDRFGQTRVHKTPSGGFHVLFRTAEPYLDLRTRANIVPGLDSRGKGGWIAFGGDYAVVNDRPLAWLPPKVCAELHKGAGRATAPTAATGGAQAIREPAEVDARGTRIKLTRALRACRSLRERWRGIRGRFFDRQVDATRSGLDHSAACLLALCGFDYDEIVWLLLNVYDHGAAKAQVWVTEQQRLLNLTFETTPEAELAADVHLRLIATVAAERIAAEERTDA